VQGTQVQIADQIRGHNKNLRKWKENENVTKALQKQLIITIKPAYLAHLEDPFSGFNKVAVRDILHDQFTDYGKIRSTDLMACNKHFEEDWNPSETFQTVMAQIKQCCDFADDARQAYSEHQILAKAYAIVLNTGLYYKALEKWDEVLIRQATYNNFCKHMIEAQTRLQTKKRSIQQCYGLAVEQIQ
jgi:hypothetical protein